MSCAKIDPASHQAQKPPWIKVRLPSNPVFFSTKALISDLRNGSFNRHRSAGSGFPRARLVYPNRARCWPRHLQPQPGNGRAPDTAGPLTRKVPDLAASFASSKETIVSRWRDRHEKRCHAWSGRKGNGTFPDDGRLARGRLRSADDGPISAAKR